MDKWFLVQIKRKNGVFEKGVVIKDSYDDALQSYYAYMGAYAFGHEEGTDYVHAQVLNPQGVRMDGRCWERPEVPEEQEVQNDNA